MSQTATKLSRRSLVTAAAGTGALAATIPLLSRTAAESSPAPAAAQPPARGGGYRLSEHVKRYYQTTLV